MKHGWQCPHCGKAHAPSVQTCPEPTTTKAPYRDFPFPHDPYIPGISGPMGVGLPPTMPKCGCRVGSVCGSVACPHKPVITC